MIRKNSQNDTMTVTRKRPPARRKKSEPVGDWLPLPMALTLAAGMVMLAVFQQSSAGAAVLAAATFGLLGWWWWHHSIYHTRPDFRRKARRAPARRTRRTTKTR
jgi:hypothetical protein